MEEDTSPQPSGPSRIPRYIDRLLHRPVISQNTLILILSLIIGLLTGIGAYLFRLLIHWVQAVLE
ncbi:MAG: hypothetical protein GF355_16370, partial [Candidatus Eisenbacteria bacterium]|nr:hypothetical protein [Candidatus Eisenbacteria bacterium]